MVIISSSLNTKVRILYYKETTKEPFTFICPKFVIFIAKILVLTLFARTCDHISIFSIDTDVWGQCPSSKRGWRF